MTQLYRLQMVTLVPLIALTGCNRGDRSTPDSFTEIRIVHVDPGGSDGAGLLDSKLPRRAGIGYKITVMMSRDGIDARLLHWNVTGRRSSRSDPSGVITQVWTDRAATAGDQQLK